MSSWHLGIKGLQGQTLNLEIFNPQVRLVTNSLLAFSSSMEKQQAIAGASCLAWYIGSQCTLTRQLIIHNNSFLLCIVTLS